MNQHNPPIWGERRTTIRYNTLPDVDILTKFRLIRSQPKEEMKDEFKEILLHVAGATVRHKNPFQELVVPRNEESLTQEFIEKWVSPFYMTNFKDDAFAENYAKVREEINSEIVTKLLGEFNWRSRIAAAYFIAIEMFYEFEDTVGHLLLRSDVCYAGHGYCLTLATLNTEKSMQFLQQYLRYYLKQKKLWFDQLSAMAALAYLDRKNVTNYVSEFRGLWKQFVKNKPNWNLDSSIDNFAQSMLALEDIRNVVNG